MNTPCVPAVLPNLSYRLLGTF